MTDIDRPEGMTVAEIASVLGISIQRARVLVRKIPKLKDGHSGPGSGSRWRREDVALMLSQKIAAAERDRDRWQARLDAVKEWGR